MAGDIAALIAFSAWVALLGLIGLLGRAARRRCRARATLATGAEVRRLWRDGDGPWCIEYRFILPDGTAMTGTAYAGCLRAALPEEGARVTVLYDPRDPRVSRLAG